MGKALKRNIQEPYVSCLLERVAGFRQKAWLVAPNTGYLAY